MRNRLLITVLTVLAMSLAALGKNTKTTVEKVTTAITLTDDEDYVVNGSTPFDDEGVVNIENTEHAVLIVERVKPSTLISTLLTKHVKINGNAARNGVNCQVRLYGTRGSMVLPYAQGFQPLTVYSEQDFGGEQCSSFGLENDGGYMVTLTEAKLNNRIRSFRLKRGYMVTFATQQGGYGYQRCFIANDQDVEMATLPQILDAKISSYRVFKWNTAGKKGLASNSNAGDVAAVGAISCYDWGVGHDMLPDVECVANHLYEDYPTSGACGSATWTCHMKTNNEPRNSSDDRPQTLATILDNWQNLMRTGMRLCSPSSWDGSDYKDGSGFLKQFFDSIDARGWRCDLADVHCYWLIDDFNSLSSMHSKYKRPIWVSEWMYGASWNSNGSFGSGVSDGDVAWAVQKICEKLNSYGFVERYYYWNSESKGKLIKDGSLTQAGKYYANQLTGMGYNSSYEKVPNTPRMRGGFRDFRVTASGTTATIAWHDYDGEYNQVMEVLRKEPMGAWQTWRTIRPEDTEADYQITDDSYAEGTRYRLHIRSFGGRDYYSSQDMEPGEAIETADGSLRYVGGNVIVNGQFRMGLYGWTNGTGQPLGQPWFEVFPQNRSDGYFLQGFANQGKDGEGSLKTAFDIVPQQDYVLRLAGQDFGDYVKLDVRMKGESTDANRLTLKNTTYWTTQQGVFNSGDYNEALLAFRWLAAKGMMGDIELYRLFDNRDDAIADGTEMARRKALAVMDWNTGLPGLNDELQLSMDALQGSDETTLAQLQQAIENLLLGVQDKLVIDSLLTVAKAVSHMDFYGHEALLEAIEAAGSTEKATSYQLAGMRLQLQEALNDFLPMGEAAVQPQSADLATADGWNTKTGTYTGGDQRTATQQEKTCWNAWWSGVGADEGTAQTMAIDQRMSGLQEGLYALECKAATQHYCLTDQHGFLKVTRADGTEEVETPVLSRDYLDMTGTISAWQTLTTTPVYIGPDDQVTIGFASSKQGAVDNAWRRLGLESDNNGDKREGWWCATDFRLLFHPMFKFDATPGQYATVCLPYQYNKPEGVRLYSIAGLLSDYSQLCLEPVDEPMQGYPYVYVADQSSAVFYTYGTAARTPVRTGVNNMYGTFTSIGNVLVGAYQLREDGEWYRVEADNRPPNKQYSAVLRRAEGLPLFEAWSGLTMPIHGVKDELGEPSGIQPVSVQTGGTSYTVGGQRTTRQKGPRIKVAGKQVRKTL